MLARLIAALTDLKRAARSRLYDTVRKLDARRALGKALFVAAYRKGWASVQGETGYTTMERTGIRPSSLDVNGI